MEIMISMGIALVGIMGIMALMPMAANNLGKGIEADAASTFGRGALHQITSRDMINGDWIAVDQNGDLGRVFDNFGARSQRSFCIDPLYVGRHYEDLSINTTTGVMPYWDWKPIHGVDWVFDTTVADWYLNATYVDYYSQPRMLRASLPQFPSRPNVRPIVTALAQQICESQDDLAFERPKDATLPPLQVYDRLRDPPSDGSSVPIRDIAPRLRQSEGRFSWMATVVPEIDSRGNVTDEFRRLSIVVFHNRVIDPAVAPNSPEQQEIVFDVNLDGGGIAGGDVTLIARPGRASDLSEVRQGDWIMLGGSVFNANPKFQVLQQQFRWYRVVDTASETVGRTRAVTLVGPDWTRSEWRGYNPNRSPADNANLRNWGSPGETHYMRTQATWVRGVVSVLEKTVGVHAHDH